MTKTKRIQILCLLGAVTLLLSGCWTEAPVESANGLLGDQEPADQQEEVILPAAFTLPYDPDQTLDPVTCADGMQPSRGCARATPLTPPPSPTRSPSAAASPVPTGPP